MMAPTDPTPQSESSLTTPPAVEEPLATVAASDDDDKRRMQLLADPRIHESVRSILRRRGVAPDQVDDKLQELLEEVLQNLSGLPLDPEEARMYLCGGGRFKAIHDAHDRKRETDHRAKVTPKDPDTRSPSLDDLVHARALLEKGNKRFPKWMDWLLRYELGGESHGEIAASVNRSPETVRKAIKSIQESLASADKRKVSVVIVAALLALVFGMDRWRRISHVSWDDQLSSTANAPAPRSDERRPKQLNPYDDPPSLRAMAKEECSLGQWDLCKAHLHRADVLDPDGLTLELVELEGVAQGKLESMPAKPGSMTPRRP